MFPKSKVTEIYCMTDDFCKEFSFQQEKYMIEDKKIGHRNKPNRMSDAEMMVILILFHSGGFRCFKHYYKEYVCKHLEHLFPHRVSYNRFVELEKEVLLLMTIFIKKVLLETCTGISFVDSPPLRVCRNQRILIHKTFEGLAERGRCSMGWFFADNFLFFDLYRTHINIEILFIRNYYSIFMVLLRTLRSIFCISYTTLGCCNMILARSFMSFLIS